MIELVDTHCHIHASDYGLEPETVLTEAAKAGVTRLLAVGCDRPDSELAVNFAQARANVWASVGLHPHDSAEYARVRATTRRLRALASQPKVVAIGECGLDYHYMRSPKEDQQAVFRAQLALAAELDLPVIFHVREAFDDFGRIVADYRGLKGVVHSFSSNRRDLEAVLSRNFFVGLNGIMTFTENKEQLAAAKAVPLDRLLLETDAPFLTPVPFRGRICQPGHLRATAEFLADLRGESLERLAAATTANAKELFKLL